MGFAPLKKAAAMGSVGAHECCQAMFIDYGHGTQISIAGVPPDSYLIAAKVQGNANAEYHVGVFYS